MVSILLQYDCLELKLVQKVIKTHFNSMDSGNIASTNIQLKWSEGLIDKIRFNTLTKAFKNAKTNSSSVYQHFILFKLLIGKLSITDF